MSHIDHHTLELYVLKSASISGKRRRVARHLAHCPDCQAIADEILLIYTEAEKHVQPMKSVPGISTGIVTEWKERSLSSRDPEARPLVRVPGSLVQRFVRFSRSHPIVASTGIFTSIVFLVFGTTMVMRWVAPPANPAKIHYDTSRDILEIYDDKDHLLWQKPSRGLKDLQEMEKVSGAQFAVIGDLDGHGQNEVVTMLPIESANTQPISNSIRIFSSNGDVIASKTLGDKVSFEGRPYQATQFWGGGLALVRIGNGVGMEVVASAPHYRSPTVVARVNDRGELLGEYWHFGHIICTQTVHSATGNGDEVILIGSNDVDSTSIGKFPVIVVLDPSKIHGQSEATATRGFGFPPSTAEVVYIRIPNSDMDDALHAVVNVVKFMPGDGKHWSFIVDGSDTINYSSFEYVFDSGWRIESVMSTDVNARVRPRLQEKGLVHGQIDKQYLNALKNSVEYWDGRKWNKEFCLVHAIPAQN